MLAHISFSSVPVVQLFLLCGETARFSRAVGVAESFMCSDAAYKEAALLLCHTVKAAIEAFTVLEHFCTDIKGRHQRYFLCSSTVCLCTCMYAGASLCMRKAQPCASMTQISIYLTDIGMSNCQFATVQ